MAAILQTKFAYNIVNENRHILIQISPKHVS